MCPLFRGSTVFLSNPQSFYIMSICESRFCSSVNSFGQINNKELVYTKRMIQKQSLIVIQMYKRNIKVNGNKKNNLKIRKRYKN